MVQRSKWWSGGSEACFVSCKIVGEMRGSSFAEGRQSGRIQSIQWSFVGPWMVLRRDGLFTLKVIMFGVVKSVSVALLALTVQAQFAREPELRVLFLGDQGHHRPADRFKQLQPV